MDRRALDSLKANRITVVVAFRSKQELVVVTAWRSGFTGEEVRFLRKSLGWSGSDFAKHMGVAEETVSRWENDAAPIGPQADRLPVARIA
jgi:DNA-binding transcriptional regulator YiaG